MKGGVPNNTVHGGIWGEWEWQALAATIGLERPADAIGRWNQLEHRCLSLCTLVLPERMFEILLGTGGAAAAVDVGLAVVVEGGLEVVYPQTVAKVRQWAGKHQRDVAAGEARARQAKERGERGPDGRFCAVDDNPSSHAQPDDQPEPSQVTGQPPAGGPAKSSSSSSASSSASASAPTEKQSPPLPPKGGRARKAGKGQLTQEERELGLRILAAITERTGVAYQGSDHHLKLIAGRLRDGASYRDLRSVVAYCWHKSGLNWGERADGKGEPMRRNLRPETLFGPEGIHRYLDAARTWFEQEVRHRLSPEELAELGEEPTRAPPALVGEPANVVQLRRVP